MSCAPPGPQPCVPHPQAPVTPHLCSYHRRGPAHSPHHRHSGTFQAGSRSSRTHRGSPERTRPHLWGFQVSWPHLQGPACSVLRPGHPGLTLAGAVVLCRVEAHLAFTAIPAGGIKALPVLTEAHVLRTFVPAPSRKNTRSVPGGGNTKPASCFIGVWA